MSSSVTIKKAVKAYKKNILRFYRQQHYSARFIGLDNCYLVYDNQEHTADVTLDARPDVNPNIIAAVIVSQIEPQSDTELLHALVVDKTYQHLGIASALLQLVLDKHQNIVCFTQPLLGSLYKKNGFVLSDALQLPEHLQARFTRYQHKQKTLQIFAKSLS